jgi:hypothetical protein
MVLAIKGTSASGPRRVVISIQKSRTATGRKWLETEGPEEKEITKRDLQTRGNGEKESARGM